jgi:hypothetical protein
MKMPWNRRRFELEEGLAIRRDERYRRTRLTKLKFMKKCRDLYTKQEKEIGSVRSGSFTNRCTHPFVAMRCACTAAQTSV